MARRERPSCSDAGIAQIQPPWDRALFQNMVARLKELFSRRDVLIRLGGQTGFGRGAGQSRSVRKSNIGPSDRSSPSLKARTALVVWVTYTFSCSGFRAVF